MKVEQSLHGYRSGHELLASSVRLPAPAQRMMLAMSDLSGQVGLKATDSYLTGYAVADAPFYVLARTWGASEMERPGCAWTHSILIPFEELPQLRHAARLLLLHSRPLADEIRTSDWARFSASVLHDDVPVERTPVVNEPLLCAMLISLYGEPSRALWAPCEASTELDFTLMLIWDQMWPRLRRGFSFCTSAGRPRSLARRPLDLQFAAQSHALRWRREHADLLELPLAETLPPTAPWLAEALADLAAPSDLRTFLWRYGAEAEPPRAGFIPLVQVARAKRSADDKRDYDGLVRLVSEAFPDAAAMGLLKREVFGRASDELREEAIVRALVAAGSGAARPAELHLDTRIVDCVRRSPALGGLFLATMLDWAKTEARESGISALTAAVLEGAPDLFATMAIPVLEHLLIVHPAIATSPALWKRSWYEQRQLFRAVEGVQDPELRLGIARALLASGTDDLADDVARAWGAAAVGAVADAMLQGTALSWRWRAVAAGRVEELLGWLSHAQLRPSRALASFLAETADPLHVSRVLKDLAPLIALGTPVDDVALFEFGVAACSGERGARLAEVSFQAAHDALSYQRASHAAWSRLSNYLPTLSFFSNWDRCERLRRRLSDNVLAGIWQPSVVLAAVSDEETFRFVLRQLDSLSGGRTVLRSLRRSTAPKPTRAQQSLLEAFAPRDVD